MALGATVHVFDIEFADSDRSVYETLSIRAARHPSESAGYLVTRVLAWCLEFNEGIAFSKGLSDPDEPAIAVRDLTGQLVSWIDIGTPDAARLHRASKAAPRVAVYTHKDAAKLVERLRGERIHRAAKLELYAFDPDFIAALAGRLERRMAFSLAVAERQLYLSVDGDDLSAEVARLSL